MFKYTIVCLMWAIRPSVLHWKVENEFDFSCFSWLLHSIFSASYLLHFLISLVLALPIKWAFLTNFLVHHIFYFAAPLSSRYSRFFLSRHAFDDVRRSLQNMDAHNTFIYWMLQHILFSLVLYSCYGYVFLYSRNVTLLISFHTQREWKHFHCYLKC